MKPYSFEIKAFYREGENMVSIYQDSKGVVTLYPTTTGGQHAGDYILHPEDIATAHSFINEALENFKDLVKVNETAFVRRIKKL